MVKEKESNHLDDVKDEVLSEKEKVNVEVVGDDDPSWYHYVVVILVFIGVLYGLFFFFSYLDSDKITIENSSTQIRELDSNNFYYDFEVKGKNISVEFSDTLENLDLFDVPIELSRFNLMSSKEIYFSFGNYSGDDNFNMTKNQYKLGLFLRSLYSLRIDGNHRVSLKKFSCENSTEAVKVIEFLPYSNESGVFFDGVGCIQIKSTNISNFIAVEDKMLLSFFRE